MPAKLEKAYLNKDNTSVLGIFTQKNLYLCS